MWTSFVNIFLNLLLYIYKLVGNFGVAIIIFTVLIKLLTHPLMVSQIKSSKALQELNEDPDYLAIQEKYKNDKERLAEAQMKIYKEKGINPTASCLPMLIQLPVIFALYQAVIAAIVSTPKGMLELIKRVFTQFISIQEIFPINPNFLWMNLGMPERLNISGIPFGIPVLAILVVITTIIQTKLTQPDQNDQGSETAGMMTGMMNVYMPLLMGFMAYSLASGLALYFLVSNVFTICQYAAMGSAKWENLAFWKKKEKKPAAKVRKSSPYASVSRKTADTESKPIAEKKSESDDMDDFTKIDYREFKNKKKPKKKQN